MWNSFGYGVRYYALTYWCTRSTRNILATGVEYDVHMYLICQITSDIVDKRVPPSLHQDLGVSLMCI